MHSIKGITCITNFDVTCNGYLDIIIGRDDGWIEIYELDELEQPVIRYSIVGICDLMKSFENLINLSSKSCKEINDFWNYL